MDPLEGGKDPGGERILEMLLRHRARLALNGHLHAAFGPRLHWVHRSAGGGGDGLVELELASWKYERRFRLVTIEGYEVGCGSLLQLLASFTFNCSGSCCGCQSCIPATLFADLSKSPPSRPPPANSPCHLPIPLLLLMLVATPVSRPCPGPPSASLSWTPPAPHVLFLSSSSSAKSTFLDAPPVSPPCGASPISLIFLLLLLLHQG